MVSHGPWPTMGALLFICDRNPECRHSGQGGNAPFPTGARPEASLHINQGRCHRRR